MNQTPAICHWVSHAADHRDRGFSGDFKGGLRLSQVEQKKDLTGIIV